MNNQNILIVAGGTGGHINAAIAIGEYLETKNNKVYYFSGQRYLDYQLYKNKQVVHLNVLGLRYSNPLKVIKSVFINIFSLFKILRLIMMIKPKVTIGTGGYVCGPVILMSRILNIPSFILEQNAVMGLTNKMLSRLVNKIFVHFHETIGLDKKYSDKICLVGNPIRFSYQEQAKTEATNNILIFGGSLGANQINEALEQALKDNKNENYKIIHQTGKNNSGAVIPKSDKYESFEYLNDMNKYYSWADKIICRAGASSIAELRVVGKPVLLIPFPKATDDHQSLNAKLLKEEVDFPVFISHKNTSKEQLAADIIEFINNQSLQSGKGHKNESISLIEETLKNYE